MAPSDLSVCLTAVIGHKPSSVDLISGYVIHLRRVIDAKAAFVRSLQLKLLYLIHGPCSKLNQEFLGR